VIELGAGFTVPQLANDKRTAETQAKTDLRIAPSRRASSGTRARALIYRADNPLGREFPGARA
jgi:hypothetical protein